MQIALDPARGAPLHRQITDQLRRAILERRLPGGTKLPSTRLMAAELSCARGTVLSAIEPLIAEGYVIAQAASGLFVATDLPDDLLARPAQPQAGEHATIEPPLARRTELLLRNGAAPPLPPLGISPVAFPLGQPDHQAFPFRLWAKLLEQEWRRPSRDLVATPHPFGHPALRQAIAAYLGTARGFACAPRAVVITSGVRHGVSLFARVALDAGDRAWIEEPGYPGVSQALSDAAVDPVPVPIDDSGFAPERAMALASDARLAVVTPSHQFPLGTVLGLQRRLALLNWAESARGWILEDDFDGEYRYAGRPLAPLRSLDRTGRVAYLGSLSKILFPALRLSFLVLPDALVEVTERIMETVSSPAPLLGQGALARFIAEGHLAAHLRRTRLLYQARQQALVSASRRHLTGLLDIPPDPGGMHLIARPGSALAECHFNDVALTKAAAASSVRVVPLSACYRGSQPQSGFLLGYAGTAETEIEAAVGRLRSVLAPLT